MLVMKDKFIIEMISWGVFVGAVIVVVLFEEFTKYAFKFDSNGVVIGAILALWVVPICRKYVKSHWRTKEADGQ